ncbi:hypothetical protein HPB52_022518 [Rhipicephalus sanguineus]|uniref:Uncharacterized protein n=1 Tax=Rhipicephalus sanguineus TaxID=34632 RepID=A0A9D4PXZ1_RHISA|nr:hypothetical protein HPB52_022518 [Rhipicephalus sanguineus]
MSEEVGVALQKTLEETMMNSEKFDGEQRGGFLSASLHLFKCVGSELFRKLSDVPWGTVISTGLSIFEKMLLSGRSWWSCLKSHRWDEASSVHEKRFVEELFTLKLAVKVLESAVGSDMAFLQLRSLETLTGRQTFYVSYCSRSCYRVDGENSRNLAMHEEVLETIAKNFELTWLSNAIDGTEDDQLWVHPSKI